MRCFLNLTCFHQRLDLSAIINDFQRLFSGQKGIGFKSVFRVSDCPEVHSNGYHIRFDAKSGPIGYILPKWIGEGHGADADEVDGVTGTEDEKQEDASSSEYDR